MAEVEPTPDLEDAGGIRTADGHQQLLGLSEWSSHKSLLLEGIRLSDMKMSSCRKSHWAENVRKLSSTVMNSKLIDLH